MDELVLGTRLYGLVVDLLLGTGLMSETGICSRRGLMVLEMRLLGRLGAHSGGVQLAVM